MSDGALVAICLLTPFAAVGFVAALSHLVGYVIECARPPRRTEPRLRSSDWDWDRFEAEFRAHVERLERAG